MMVGPLSQDTRLRGKNQRATAGQRSQGEDHMVVLHGDEYGMRGWVGG